MVEPDWHSSWSKEDSNPIAHDERAGMIHLEAPSTVQFHGEHSVRLNLPESFQESREVIGCHHQSPRGTPISQDTRAIVRGKLLWTRVATCGIALPSHTNINGRQPAARGSGAMGAIGAGAGRPGSRGRGT